MDTRRLILFVIFSFSIMMLWDSWQKKNAPIEVAQTAQTPAASAPVSDNVSTGANSANNAVTADAMSDGTFKLEKGQRIQVATDLFQAEIDTIGGDLRHLELSKHRAAKEKEGNYVLMDDA